VLYALRRIPSALVVLFLASIAIFAVLHLAPGDPAVVLAGPDADSATIAAITHQLGWIGRCPCSMRSGCAAS